MYSIQNPSYKHIVTNSHCSLKLELEKRGVINKQDNTRLVNKDYTKVNNNKKRNLIPTEYRKLFWTLIGSQEKWNHVFNKFIERVDELNKPAIEVKEPTTH